MEKPKLVIIAKNESSFVRNDISLLKKNFRIQTIIQGKTYGLRYAFFIMHLCVTLPFILLKAVGVFIWFADYHTMPITLISRLMKKPSFLVIGGFDAANEEKLQYGALRNPIRKFCVDKSCKWASSLLPVSKFTRDDLFENLGINFSEKTTVIYNGSNPDLFKSVLKNNKKDLIITICGTSDPKVIKRKGVDFFIEVSEATPQYNFLVIGLKGQAYAASKKIAPKNLSIIEWCTHDELKVFLQRAKVICQFSRYEAFGLALIEGMLCECVPVGVKHGGTAEIITSEVGYLIPGWDVSFAKKAILQAIKNQNILGPSARKRVIEHFSLERREIQLKHKIASHLTLNKIAKENFLRQKFEE